MKIASGHEAHPGSGRRAFRLGSVSSVRQRFAFGFTRAVIQLERRWTLMSQEARLGRTLGWLGTIAGAVGLILIPLLGELDVGAAPMLLTSAALAGGIVLSAVPVAWLERLPSAFLTGCAIANQAAFAASTGDADSPFLPGFTVIVAAIAASATVRLTVWAVTLAAAGLLAVGLADAVLSASDVVRILVDAAVLMAVGITVSLLAWRRRIEVSRAAARLQTSKASAAKLRLASETDPLTGVGNRRGFEAALARLGGARPAPGVALLVADLDGLKAINDGLGHEAGDAALRAIAQGLVARLRPEDRLFRIGGDEFAAVLHRASVEGVARRFGATIRVDVDGVGSVSASVGVAAVADAMDASSILRFADQEMYARKARAR